MAFVNSSPGLARQRNPGITVRVYGIATLKGFANYRLANAVCVALFPNRFPRVSVALLPSNPGLSLANTVRVRSPTVKEGIVMREEPSLTVGLLTRNFWPPLRCSFAINHPWNTEPIDAHAEPSSPESFLERHLHTALFGQSIEDALTFGDIFQMERHIHAFGLLVTARRSI